MRDINTIVVIGAGTMGRGIAQNAATAGYRVALVDADARALESGLGAIRDVLGMLVDKGKIAVAERDAAVGRIAGAAALVDVARDADLAIEAVPEVLELKSKIFRQLDDVMPGHAILASNTSSLPIGAIASATRRPELVVGMHFFNPCR
jgi:3-hydroxybutyryl-CoA dehydrogenase